LSIQEVSSVILFSVILKEHNSVVTTRLERKSCEINLATIVYKFQSQAALLTEEICTAARSFEKKFTVYKKESVHIFIFQDIEKRGLISPRYSAL